MKARSAECRTTTPLNEDEIHKKASELWNIGKRKVLVDTYDLRDNDFKQKVINYANAKYGKGK